MSMLKIPGMCLVIAAVAIELYLVFVVFDLV